jgi:hypothetical protein
MSKLLAPLGAIALLLLAAPAAGAFEGTYAIKGSGPNDAKPYEGMARIKQTGMTYTVVWRVGDLIYLGTGILSGSVLSVVFQPINARAGPGVASLRIVNGLVAGGAWTALGAQVVAEEIWSPATQNEPSTRAWRDESAPGPPRLSRSVSEAALPGPHFPRKNAVLVRGGSVRMIGFSGYRARIGGRLLNEKQ